MSSKRKIIIVSRCSWTLYNFRRSLILELINQGSEVTTVGFELNGYSKKLASLGVKHIDLGDLRESNRSMLFQLVYFFRLLKIFAKHRADFVHLFTMQPVLFGSMAAYISRTKYIISVTGLGHLFIEGASLRQKIVSFLLRLASRYAVSSVFQNPFDIEELKKSNALSRIGNIKVIRGSGVDTDKFTPAKDISAKPKIKFTLVGRLIREKGVVEFCEAVKSLRSELTDQSEFELVGDIDLYNPTALSNSEIDAMCHESGVLRVAPKENIIPILHQTNVLVLPSYREGLSMALLEGASCGLALVASDVPGCNDIVVDKETGLLVSPRNSKQLVTAFEYYIQNSAKINEHGSNARRHVLENFSNQVVLKQYVALYQ